MTDSLASVKTVSLGVTMDNLRMAETFWDRLQEAMGDAEMKTDNLTAAANLISAHYTAATKWRDGGLPSMENAVTLAMKLGVCVQWLLTGDGPKRSTDADPRLSEITQLWPHLTEETKERVVGFAKFERTNQFNGDPDRRAEFEKALANNRKSKGGSTA